MSEERRQTKKNLRALTRDSSHPIRTEFRIIKYGIIGFCRNIWLSLASTLVMTITLLILFITIIASVVLTETATSMRDKIDITVFLKPETSAEILEKLSISLQKDENVRKDTIIKNTSEDEFNILLEENSDNKELIETLQNEDMKSITIKNTQSTIRFKVKDIDNLESVKSIIDTDTLFQKYLDEEKSPTYDVNRNEIETINSWAKIAKNGGLILSAVFLIISALVIFNTIRMAIFSRREEIYMMKLIGGSKFFIRGPFMVEAQISGLISGIISSTLGYFGFRFVSPFLESYGISVSSISKIFNSIWIVAFYIIMIMLGILIGTISARLAAKKYLRKL